MIDNPPTETLEDKIAKAIIEALKPRYGGPRHNDPGGLPLTATAEEIQLYRARPFVEAVMAVLSTPTVLREAANRLDHQAAGIDAFCDSGYGEDAQMVRKLAHLADELRHMADLPF